MSQCEPDGSRGFHGIKGSEIAIGPFAVHRRRPMFAVRRPMFGGAGLKTLLSKSSGVLRCNRRIPLPEPAALANL